MTTTDNNNKSNNRGSKFIKDIGIYAIGNIGSKIITFLMVPLYTYFMPNKSDFGYYDVCLSMCFLLIPFVTLQMRDGAFRFLLDCDDDTRRQRIVTFVTRSMLTTMTLAVLVTIVLSLTTKIGYLGYSLGLLIALALQDVYSQVFRGLGHGSPIIVGNQGNRPIRGRVAIQPYQRDVRREQVLRQGAETAHTEDASGADLCQSFQMLLFLLRAV